MNRPVSLASPPGCRLLDWDTAFFGRPIARLDPAALTAANVPATEAWCRAQGIACAYLLVDHADQRTIEAATAAGFGLVDVRLTLEAKAAPSGPLAPVAPAVRPFAASDSPALVAIARESHHDTRFYKDPNFDRARCDDLYETWIRRSCQGWADQVLVAVCEGVAAGYITCHRVHRMGQIGLVGVHPSFRGRGLARAMVDAARRWCADLSLSGTRVVTQGGNTPAVRLYESAGFAIVLTEHWYHRWF